MNKRYWNLIIFTLLLSLLIGCGQAEEAKPTNTTQPTSAPAPTNTTQPTNTARAEPTAIPGWEKFEGKGVELWLPEHYEGGNLDDDLDVIVDTLRSLGPDFEQMAQLIEQNPSAFVLWVFDSEVGDSGFLTNANITKERVLSAITVETYLDAAVKQLPAQFRVLKQEMVDLNGYRAGRLLIELTLAGERVKEVLYTVKEDNTMWNVTYATAESEFDERLPEFEQSIRTLRIQP